MSMTDLLLNRMIVFTCLILLGVECAGGQDEKGTPKFTLSAETTFFTRPVRKDGFVDYASAINSRLNQGIKPSENACVDLYRALGPAPENHLLSPNFFRQIGMERPQKRDHYLKSLWELTDKKTSDEQVEKIIDRQYHVMTNPWTRKEYPRMFEWLQQNERSLRFFNAASQREKYFSPLITEATAEGQEPLVAVLIPGPQECREAARLLSARAMWRLQQGKTDAAWSDLLACKRLGRLIGMGPTFTECLIGVAMESIAHEAMITLVRESKLTLNQVNRYRSQLKQIPPFTPLHEKCNLAERCMVLDAIGVMRRGNKEELEILQVDYSLGGLAKIVALFDLKFDLDLAFRACNKKFNQMTEILKESDYPTRAKLLDEHRSQEGQLMAKMKRIQADDGIPPAKRTEILSRLLGEVAAQVFQGHADAPSFAVERTRQQAVLIDVAFGLSAYHTENNGYPKRLADLRPKYLANQPVDYFSVAELKYRKVGKGYLLYSIGQNMKDDGGRGYDDEPQGDDLSIKLQAN